jgi:nitrate reductase NapAB chaperone NapD
MAVRAMPSDLFATNHISSAIIRFGQNAGSSVLDQIDDMHGVEVVYADHTTAIVVIERPSSNAAGEALAGIAAVEGVLSAVLAYEQSVSNEVEGEGA